MTIQEIITLLEAATGPDRDLDLAVAIAVWGRPGRLVMRHNDETGQNEEYTHWHYTSSIDAAWTLVPEGFRWSCGFSKHVPHNAQVWTGTGYYEGECDSDRAIALCIAALKARLAIPAQP